MNTILGSVQQGPKAFRSAVMTSAYSSTGTMPRTTPYAEAARPAEVNDAIMELAAAKRAWMEAQARGDTAAMQQAHERANQIRARLGNYAQEAERAANQIATGRPEGLPQRPATAPTGGMAPAQTGAAAPSRPAGSAGTGRTGAGGASQPQPPPQEPPQPPPSEPPAWLLPPEEPPGRPELPEPPAPYEPESAEQLRSDLQEGAALFRAIQNEPIDVQAYFTAAASQILELAKQLEQEIRQEFEKQQTVLDPQTEEALRVLREQMELTLQATREDLNRRGLFESGILLELENRIRKQGLTDQQKILAQRLQALRDKLETRLNQIREWRLKTAGDLYSQAAKSQAEAALDYEKRRADFAKAFMEMRVKQRRQQYEDAVARYDRDIERRLKEYDRLYEQYRDAKEDEKWQYEQELKLLELQLETDYRAKELEIRRQEAQRRARGSGSSGGDATLDYIRNLAADLEDGSKTIDQAQSDVWDNREALQAVGVDPHAVLRWIDQVARTARPTVGQLLR
ncbi:coiled-coil domain-containing protein [Caldinitratiruptor microaerophilus]|nr:hypothetical protein [Caldinitratiruptor microaerophilus]